MPDAQPSAAEKPMTIDDRIQLFNSPTGRQYLRIGRMLDEGKPIWIARDDISDDCHLASLLRETMRQAVESALASVTAERDEAVGLLRRLVRWRIGPAIGQDQHDAIAFLARLDQPQEQSNG